jgi:hypothetical protein
MQRNLILIILFSTVNAWANLPDHYETIDWHVNLELLVENAYEPSGVTASDDGEHILYIAKKSKRSLTLPLYLWTVSKNNNQTWQAPELVPKKLSNLYTSGGFSPDNQNIVANEEVYQLFALSRSLGNMMFGNDPEPIGFKSCISIYNTNNNYESERRVCAADMGLKNEMLQHVRQSPDLKWISFYIKGKYNPMGIYLYHSQTEKLYHLGTHPDKHPTWSPNGDLLLFHTQVGGNSRVASPVEMASIGYYHINSSDPERSLRTVLKSNQPGYAFHKHPAIHPQTGLLFFHGQLEDEGRKAIMVRRLRQGSTIYVLNILDKNDHYSLRSAKHPATANINGELFFIARERGRDQNGDRPNRKIFKIGNKAIDQLNRLIP